MSPEPVSTCRVDVLAGLVAIETFSSPEPRLGADGIEVCCGTRTLTSPEPELTDTGEAAVARSRSMSPLPASAVSGRRREVRALDVARARVEREVAEGAAHGDVARPVLDGDGSRVGHRDDVVDRAPRHEARRTRRRCVRRRPGPRLARRRVRRPGPHAEVPARPRPCPVGAPPRTSMSPDPPCDRQGADGLAIGLMLLDAAPETAGQRAPRDDARDARQHERRAEPGHEPPPACRRGGPGSDVGAGTVRPRRAAAGPARATGCVRVGVRA